MMDFEKTIDILLVEDNPHDTELTTHALSESSKYLQLTHLKDGVEALDFIFARKACHEASFVADLKLVLLDLKLPRMDGLEVLQKIRENETTKALPVVILTSSRERKDIRTAYKLGVNSYVVKPVSFDSYIQTIGALAFYWGAINERPL